MNINSFGKEEKSKFIYLQKSHEMAKKKKNVTRIIDISFQKSQFEL